MSIDWGMGAKLFIGAARNGAFSQLPDLEAELGSCVTLIRSWPKDVAFSLHTERPVLGKVVLGRDDIALLPEPG